jgi:hypothetical protein
MAHRCTLPKVMKMFGKVDFIVPCEEHFEKTLRRIHDLYMHEMSDFMKGGLYEVHLGLTTIGHILRNTNTRSIQPHTYHGLERLG